MSTRQSANSSPPEPDPRLTQIPCPNCSNRRLFDSPKRFLTKTGVVRKNKLPPCANIIKCPCCKESIWFRTYDRAQLMPGSNTTINT